MDFGLINLIPHICHRLCNAAITGNIDEACRIWGKFLPLVNLETYLDDNREPHWLSFIKSGFETIGYEVGKPRLPILTLIYKHKRSIVNILSKLEKQILI